MSGQKGRKFIFSGVFFLFDSFFLLAILGLYCRGRHHPCLGDAKQRFALLNSPTTRYLVGANIVRPRRIIK